MNPLRTLFLSGTAPGTDGVGAIILRDELGFLPEKSASFFHVGDRSGTRIAENGFSLFSQQIVSRRFETAYRRGGKVLGELTSNLGISLLLRRYLRRVMAEAVALGNASGTQQVVAVLDCPSTILIARSVANKLSVPLKCLVWDSPELFINQLHWPSRAKRELLREFGNCLIESKSNALIGEAMVKEYRDRYGQKATGTIVRHGVAESLWHFDKSPEKRDYFAIGFAGSMTAPDAFNALISSLDRTKWKILNKPVVLRLFGCRYTCNSTNEQWIEYFGRQSVANTIRLLSDCDLCYLPQPFGGVTEPLSRWSFPTKLSTYLPSGVPVFLHAPNFSSLTEFLKRFEFGPFCDSLEPEEIVTNLTTALADTSILGHYRSECYRCIKEELNMSVFRERFLEFYFQ